MLFVVLCQCLDRHRPCRTRALQPSLSSGFATTTSWQTVCSKRIGAGRTKDCFSTLDVASSPPCRCVIGAMLVRHGHQAGASSPPGRCVIDMQVYVIATMMRHRQICASSAPSSASSAPSSASSAPSSASSAPSSAVSVSVKSTKKNYFLKPSVNQKSCSYFYES